ncbi:hypothetical protein Dsin_005523, partial [Dipteronia sinensis]
GIRWCVGSGSNIRVFSNPWTPRPFGFRPIALSPSVPADLLVRDLLYPSGGGWNIQVLSETLLPSEREVVLVIPVAKLNCQDKMIWHFDKHGEYTVKSGYSDVAFQYCQLWIIWLGERCMFLIAATGVGMIRRHSSSKFKQVNRHWSPPPFGHLTLNVDVAFRSGNVVGVGAVLRDHFGSVRACVELPRLGFFSAEVGELFAIHESMLFLNQMGLQVHCLESDSTIAVSSIKHNPPFSAEGPLLDDIMKLFAHMGCVNCFSIPREGNCVAHSLAKYATM